jgi:hypothetical protein
MRDFSNMNGFLESYRVSAKEDINISSAFSDLTREMIIAEFARPPAGEDIHPRTSLIITDKKKKGCSC